MSKILIISYYYKHKNAMASIRAIKLAKYFSLEGHDVTVLTSNQRDTWTKNINQVVFDSKIKEIYCEENKFWTKIYDYLEKRKKNKINNKNIDIESDKFVKEENVDNKILNLKNKITNIIKWSFYFLLAILEDLTLFWELKRTCNKNLEQCYEIVISTYPTYGAMMMGNYMKLKKKCKVYVADFRDPLYNPKFRPNKIEQIYDKWALCSVLKRADFIICVSEGIKKGINEFIEKYRLKIDKSNISVIYNGYDLDDIKIDSKSIKLNNKIVNFVYTGTLYEGKRTIEVLGKILEELIYENKINKADFCLHYAGPHKEEWLKQISLYGLEKNTKIYGFVSRECSLELQSQASALVLLTWDEKDYEGVIPGKLFEYMAYKSIPIIAIITGDNQNCEVSRIIDKSNCGISYEYARPDKEKMKLFILELFKSKREILAEVEVYNYKSLSKQYIKKIKL